MALITPKSVIINLFRDEKGRLKAFWYVPGEKLEGRTLVMPDGLEIVQVAIDENYSTSGPALVLTDQR